MGVQCFFIVPSERVNRSLRRYTHRTYKPGQPAGWTCAEGWHEARVPIGPVFTIPRTKREDLDKYNPEEVSGDRWPHTDERWPKACSKGCGYIFTDEDAWQLFCERAYVRLHDPVEGESFSLVLRDDTLCPPGAMWDAWWMPWKGPDGICLTVQLPDGAPWCVDGPATGGGHWVRTGDPKANPPTVDVNPSIASGNPQTYHGFLRNGSLIPA